MVQKIFGTQRNGIFILVVIILIGGCSSSKPLNDSTASATLWMQNAAEYKALTTMVYQSAASELSTAMNVNSWTASVEQESMQYRNLPPAVVLDVDETVLDNAPYQARLIKNNKTYSTKSWNKWVREEKADAIAGALAFTKEAASRGITVFYLTNREASVEESTYDNLEKLGFPLKEGTDVLLTKNERQEWTSAKVNRRKYLATNYRILMLFGDNLNDFLPAEDMSSKERKALIDEHSKRFGTQWFVFPNPVYGSWEQALNNFDNSLSPSEKEKNRMDALDTKD